MWEAFQNPPSSQRALGHGSCSTKSLGSHPQEKTRSAAYSLDIFEPGRPKWERRRGPGLLARSPPRARPASRDASEDRTHQHCERTARAVAPSTAAAMGCKALDRGFRGHGSAVRPAVPRAAVRQSRRSARPRSGHGGAGARVAPPLRSPAPHFPTALGHAQSAVVDSPFCLRPASKALQCSPHVPASRSPSLWALCFCKG